MIRVSDIAFEPETELLAFREGLADAGAVASFTGIVRDDGHIDALTLSHYPGFTEKQIESFAAQAKDRWPQPACVQRGARYPDFTPRWTHAGWGADCPCCGGCRPSAGSL